MKTATIPIGRSEVFKNRDLNIKIVLGSCIGLVIYHEETKITGAIHILLPRFKTARHNEERITAYADTGIKHLLLTMKKYTEEIKDYKAVMAGGADLGGGDYFNIGKENYIAAKKILKKYSVDIVEEDCLGKYPRVIDFYTNDFSYKIKKISSVVHPKDIEMEYDPISIIKEIKSTKKYLPVPNRSIAELIKLKEEELSLEKLEEIMLKDDFLCVNFLRFVNSAYISPKYKIRDIKQAISYIGMKNVFKFINNLFIQNLVKGDIHSYALNMYEYKIHVLSVAILSEIMGETIGEESHLVYIGGLFHDIGKVILDRFALENYTSSKRTQIISFVESSIKSTAHALIGAIYLKSLNLDEKILDIVEYHHFPLELTSNKRLGCVVALSNLLISNFMIGRDLIEKTIPFESVKDIFHILDIDKDNLNNIINTIPYVISTAEEMVI